IKDAEGSLSPREREELLQTAAGDAASAEYLQRLAEIEQAVTGQALIAGNRVQLLVDGPAAYKAMFAAIAKAQNHIHLETYILADDEIGQQLASLLLERRAAGVEVAIIFDDLGSNSTSDAYFERLQNAGIKLFRFHP
ncbi:MAG: cardiolipin synthase B, partial [Candidatus Competibacteraceae bacterium]|nr:cardiolipin synthase B [Candidatus Competibacteraceae bacterium]